jgi:hypothetical protein
MAVAEAWKKGIIAGYQSKKPGSTPSIPSYPASVPGNIRKEDYDKYYYELGFKKGCEMASK